MTTHVLPFDRTQERQDTGFWCGPASVQSALATRGIKVSEAELAREMGTTENGTNHIGLLRNALHHRLPAAHYAVVQRPNDPPTKVQMGETWWHIVRSIDNGYAVPTNWVSPPGNRPTGVKGSPSPNYGGGTVYHYVDVFGWSDEGRGGRTSVYIVDSGFRPYGYWIDFEQYVTLIPPKGYTYADLPPDPAPAGAVPTPPAPMPPPPPVPSGTLSDPFTGAVWSPNHEPRQAPGVPRWIAVHTQEGGRTARGLAQFLSLSVNGVSYHAVVDDHELLKCVAEDRAPWSASNANHYAFHVCAAGSYAGWSRDKWLETDARDGKNEDFELTNMARVVAWWCQKYDIPAVWIGGGAQPPWGRDGICGHGDLGAWGGGHHDPGPNFPVNEFVRRVATFLTGKAQPPLVTLPPASVPGTKPDRYADVLIYRGRIGNNVEQVKLIQRRLKAAYSGYAGHLVIDGVYSWSDEMAVREFQRRSHLVVDGIVGPMTAAALQPW